MSGRPLVWGVLVVCTMLHTSTGFGVVGDLQQCDAVVSRGQQSFIFLMSEAATATALVGVDDAGHTYTRMLSRGAAVRINGQPPVCDHSKPLPCVNPATGQPMCCTAPCDVIATGFPTWAPPSPRHPGEGGVIGTFPPVASESAHPHSCKGGQWRTTYHVRCLVDMPLPRLDGVVVNGTQGCDVHIFFTAASACAKFTLSIGWCIVGGLAATVLLYAALGVLYSLATLGSLSYPNRAFWRASAMLVCDGRRVVGRVCSKAVAWVVWACVGVPPPARSASTGSEMELGGGAALDPTPPAFHIRGGGLVTWAAHWVSASVIPEDFGVEDAPGQTEASHQLLAVAGVQHLGLGSHRTNMHGDLDALSVGSSDIDLSDEEGWETETV